MEEVIVVLDRVGVDVAELFAVNQVVVFILVILNKLKDNSFELQVVVSLNVVEYLVG